MLNSKNNITKWGYFWIGQDVVFDWNKFETDFPWSVYNIIDGCINNRLILSKT